MQVLTPPVGDSPAWHRTRYRYYRGSICSQEARGRGLPLHTPRVICFY